MPSRVHPGEFFALPQSPQIFKQILMIAGMDRYVQICKCFRDEDLRADRQPEFTQVDVEMSFARPETIFGHHRAADARDLRGDRPRDRDAVPPDAVCGGDGEYGSDKPDLRCGMPIQDLRELFRESPFGVFSEIVAGGGTVRGFVVPNAGGYSRSEVDGIVDQAKPLGAAGLCGRARRGRHDHDLDHEGAGRGGTVREAARRDRHGARTSLLRGGGRRTRRRSCSGSCG